MFSWKRSHSKPTPARSAFQFRPNCESLEDRTTPTVSAITTNFNGTAIPAGDALWFSSVGKVSGVPVDGATVHISHATITAAGLGTVSVPDSTIHFDPNATSASAVFNGTEWDITTPIKYSGNVFLDGVAVSLPGGLAGGIKNVVWSGDFTSDKAGVSLNWQWAASAYKSSSTDEAALGVKASDTATPQYQNSDHAGTPEVFKKSVVGGATGGGGSNYTGSYSATKSVAPEVSVAPSTQGTASISGTVWYDSNMDGVINASDTAAAGVTLSIYDSTGSLLAQTTTDANGNYQFFGLAVGTYSIAVTSEQPEAEFVGSLGGTTTTNGVSGITLTDGAVGQNYDFLLYTSLA